MPLDEPCKDYQIMTREEFLAMMAQFWDRIMVQDQGFGLIQADFRDGLVTAKQHSVRRNQATGFGRR